MKRILITSLVLLLALCMALAQTPELFKYQTVIRNSTGAVIQNQAVALRISIIKGSVNGPSVYSESHHKTTNDFGLVNLEIGVGSIESGSFSSIDWGANEYFVKIQLDATNGTNFETMGTSQLLSVPYALYAKTVKSYNEVDPVFSNSPANNISLTSISNWNTAYSWGNHANAGYLNSFNETDPTFANSPANSIGVTNISNWNSAYDWGSHVGLYRLISYVPSWIEVTNKPTFATVATSGSYSDLTNKPSGVNIGDMQYWNGSTWLIIPKGTTYQVLTMNSLGIPEWQDLPYFEVIPLNYEVSSFAGDTAFIITSNAPWLAQSDQTWCKILNTSGVGNSILRINFDKNIMNKRVANITLSCAGLLPKIVQIIQNPIENVALLNCGATASAISTGSYDGITRHPFYVIDGDSTSHWASNWSMPSWIQVNFDKIYTISTVGAYFKDTQHTYTISLSADGINWTVVVPSRLSGNNPGTFIHEKFQITPMQAKYIKCNISSTSAPSGWIFQSILYELEAFGY